MAITTEPVFEILPAYRPIKFLAEINIDATVWQPENAVVSIYKNAVLLATVRYKVAYSTPATPPNKDYFFEIDIQKFCQDSLAPDTTTSMPLVFAGTGEAVVDCNDCYGDYNIEITYEGVDLATGLLEDMGISTDTSSTFTIISSTRQHGEVMDLAYFYGTAGLQNGHCLTKSSRELSVCEDDNAFLAYISPNSSVSFGGMQVKLYNSAGVLLSEGFSSTTVPVNSNLFAANVGVNSLKSTTFVDGTPDFLDPDLAHYTVSFGTSVNLPPWTYARHTDTFTFTVNAGCCGRRSIRFHWLNYWAV